MFKTTLWLSALVLGVFVLSPARAAELTAAEKSVIFKAAGFKAKGNTFSRCEDDTTASASPGSIEMQDLNADGTDEARVREGSLFCYGNTAEAFVLLNKNAKGEWTPILDEVGVALPLKTKTRNWLDIEVGGPGMGPFPVFRYSGKKYVRK